MRAGKRRRLEREGFEVTICRSSRNGLVDLDRSTAAITERTALVSVMAVNNEIGVIQPLAEIGALCRAPGRAVPHRRGAGGRQDPARRRGAMNIDLMSISGHKIYGPKGIGALYVRRRPRVRLEPLIDGGGQERGLRSGTLPTPLAVGLGEACAVAAAEMAAEAKRLTGLRDRFLARLTAAVPDVALATAIPTHRIPGNLNLSFRRCRGRRS